MLTDENPLRETSAYFFCGALLRPERWRSNFGAYRSTHPFAPQELGKIAAALGALMALLAIPWTLKPFFALLSDFVPRFGSRRRNYLLVANGLAALSLLLLAFTGRNKLAAIPRSLASAYFVSVITGAAYMTGTLVQLDLTARMIPA